jgi:hypothetical protein
MITQRNRRQFLRAGLTGGTLLLGGGLLSACVAPFRMMNGPAQPMMRVTQNPQPLWLAHRGVQPRAILCRT